MTTTTEAPANTTYGTVVGRFLRMVADSPDPDVEVDAVPATGTITFVAEAEYLLDIAGAPPTTLIPTPIVCHVDTEGYLVDGDGNTGVTLLATDGPTNPVDFTYQATLAFAGSAARTFSFSLPAGTIVDLTLVSPLTSSTGTVIVQGPQGKVGPIGPVGPIGTSDFVPALAFRKVDEWTGGATTDDDSANLKAAFADARSYGYRLVATAGKTYRGCAIDNTGVYADWRGSGLKVPDGVVADHIFEPLGGFTLMGGLLDGNMAATIEPAGTAGASASGIWFSTLLIPWTASSARAVGQQTATASGIYEVTTAGITAASGTGPTGTGTGILDGTVVWKSIPGGWDGLMAVIGTEIKNCWGRGVSTVGNNVSILDAKVGPFPSGQVYTERVEAHHNRGIGIYSLGISEPVHVKPYCHHGSSNGLSFDRVYRGVAENLRCHSNGVITTPESTPGARDAVGTGHGFVSVHSYGDVVEGIANDNVDGGFVWGGADPSGLRLAGRCAQIGRIVARRNGVLTGYQGVTFDPTRTNHAGEGEQVDHKVSQLIATDNGAAGLQITQARFIDFASVTADGNASHGISNSGVQCTFGVMHTRNNGGNGVSEYGTTTNYGGHSYGPLDSTGNLGTNGVVFQGTGSRLMSTFLMQQTGAPTSAGRVQAVTTIGTLTVNADLYNRVKITAQATALIIANPTGSPGSMQGLVIRVKDSGSSRAITYGSQFRPLGTPLPAATVANKILVLGFMWNSDDSKWDLLAVQQEA